MNNTFGANNSNQSPKFRSFLESLRKQSSVEEKPKSVAAGDFFEKYKEERKLEEVRKAEFFRARKKEFNEVYNYTKKKEEEKIRQLQEKLRAMTVSMRKLKKEVEIAVETPVVEAGVYHEGMIEHLMAMVELMKQQVESSATWLHLFNQRSKKMGYYWGMVGKKGTKFSMSEERQMTTSIG